MGESVLEQIERKLVNFKRDKNRDDQKHAYLMARFSKNGINPLEYFKYELTMELRTIFNHSDYAYEIFEGFKMVPFFVYLTFSMSNNLGVYTVSIDFDDDAEFRTLNLYLNNKLYKTFKRH